MSILAVLIASVLAAVLFVVAAFVFVGARFRRNARRFGYPSLRAYLGAVPASDEEKRDAVSLALTGLILCLLGLLLPPFLLIGLFPLFHGMRKVAWASMGLGLIDDADQPGV